MTTKKTYATAMPNALTKTFKKAKVKNIKALCEWLNCLEAYSDARETFSKPLEWKAKCAEILWSKAGDALWDDLKEWFRETMPYRWKDNVLVGNLYNDLYLNWLKECPVHSEEWWLNWRGKKVNFYLNDLYDRLEREEEIPNFKEALRKGEDLLDDEWFCKRYLPTLMRMRDFPEMFDSSREVAALGFAQMDYENYGR